MRRLLPLLTASIAAMLAACVTIRLRPHLPQVRLPRHRRCLFCEMSLQARWISLFRLRMRLILTSIFPRLPSSS